MKGKYSVIEEQKILQVERSKLQRTQKCPLRENMNEALLVTIISKIRQIFVGFLCLARGSIYSVGHRGCLRTVLLYILSVK